jgi:chromosome segregation ATPase
MHDRPNGVTSRGGIWMLDEKELQGIEERLNALSKRGLEGFSAREHFTLHAETDIDKLIAEVRRLKEESEKEYIRGVRDTQTEYLPKINYEKDQILIWSASWNEEVDKNLKLKKEINLANQAIEALEETNSQLHKNYTKRMEKYYYLEKRYARLEKQNQRYKQALEFYSDEKGIRLVGMIRQGDIIESPKKH